MDILLYKLRTAYEKILRTVSVPVETFDSDLEDTVTKMFETLEASADGIGLAAPQIGINRRFFIMNTLQFPKLIVINPEILEATGRMKYNEGCLSFPGERRLKKRRPLLKLKYQDIKGNWCQLVANGVDAVCIQHEIDHLNGILLID